MGQSQGEALSQLGVGGECLPRLGGSRTHDAWLHGLRKLWSTWLHGVQESSRPLRRGQVSVEAVHVGGGCV
jgi:hypothetical protein